MQELRFDLHSDRIHARERRVPGAEESLRGGDRPIRQAPARLGARADPERAGRGGRRARRRRSAPAPAASTRRGRLTASRSRSSRTSPARSRSGSHLPPAAQARQLTKDHKGPLGPLVWSPDGKHIATSDREMRILLVDAKTGAITAGGPGGPRRDATTWSSTPTVSAPTASGSPSRGPEPNWNWVDLALRHPEDGNDSRSRARR